jgi:tripartite motif-containing protein 71
MGARGPAIAIALIAVSVVAGFVATGAGEDNLRLHALWLQKIGGKPLSLPVDIAVDRKGVVFLLDSGNRSIGIYSPKGEFIREIQGKGAWRDPFAICVGPDGTLFLADGEGGRVLEMDFSGKIRREYHAGKNARITGVGLFGNSVYCVDNRNDRVVVFRRGEGRPDTWGKKGERPGEFHSPFRLAVDGGGRIFVTDVMNSRVQWFSAFGQHLGTLKKFGAGEGKLFRPSGISLDNRGRIWVSDSYTGLVQLFEENGKYVRSLTLGDGRPHIFGDPVGIASASDGVWVADQRESRAALFRR